MWRSRRAKSRRTPRNSGMDGACPSGNASKSHSRKRKKLNREIPTIVDAGVDIPSNHRSTAARATETSSLNTIEEKPAKQRHRSLEEQSPSSCLSVRTSPLPHDLSLEMGPRTPKRVSQIDDDLYGLSPEGEREEARVLEEQQWRRGSILQMQSMVHLHGTGLKPPTIELPTVSRRARQPSIINLLRQTQGMDKSDLSSALGDNLDDSTDKYSAASESGIYGDSDELRIANDYGQSSRLPDSSLCSPISVENASQSLLETDFTKENKLARQTTAPEGSEMVQDEELFPRTRHQCRVGPRHHLRCVRHGQMEIDAFTTNPSLRRLEHFRRVSLSGDNSSGEDLYALRKKQQKSSAQKTPVLAETAVNSSGNSPIRDKKNEKYNARSLAGKENGALSHTVQAFQESFCPRKKNKFIEIDAWEMEFEDVDISGSSGSWR